MTTKEKIKQNLDELPNELLEQVYQFIKLISARKSKERSVRYFKLRGQFDNTDLRKRAYE